MARQRHLARAPIVEAIFDIRVSRAQGFDPLSLQDLARREGDRYPVVEEQRAFLAQLEVAPGRPPTAGTQDLGLDGFLLRAADALTLAQFRGDGFSFNRLRPYTAWEELLPEFERLWGVYREGSRPETITRVAVRFINRLVLPLHMATFREYLTAPPMVPDEAPQAVTAFLSRVTVADPERGLSAHIVQAMEPAPGQSTVGVILDIDAFSQREHIPADEVLPTFQQLRDLKNNVFFGSITEQTAEMYQ
jgi:uncharacterized protein (TIGR04255 family)